MFNLSAIMNEAWASYRRQYNKRVFNRGTFNWLLRLSWKRAKDAALRASNPIMAKVEALREQIELLSYKPWRIDIVECRRQIEAQIALLTTISATQQQ